jgi:transcriptional regulator with XRE-family HTH domain
VKGFARELGKKKELSQAQLAQLCNVKVTNISRYEMGSVKPNLEMIITLANVLNVATDTLCGLNDLQDNNLVLLAKKAAKLPKEKQQAIALVLEAFLKS